VDFISIGFGGIGLSAGLSGAATKVKVMTESSC